MADRGESVAVIHPSRVELPPLPAHLDTPALVVFLERVEANIRRLQTELDRRGVRLRPHAKTHKSARIARLQLDAGAAGLTVGTLGEAEVFAAAGIRDLFIAYPLLAVDSKARRLRSLLEAAPELSVGVDSIEGVQRLAAATAGTGRQLRVLIEIDSGGHRTGVRSAEDSVRVAEAASRAGLHVAGVFTHGGHAYAGPDRAHSAAGDEIESLTTAASALEAAGIDVEVLSAGSTPTMLDAAAGGVTEVRPGTYVLGDRHQLALGSMGADELAAAVAATVVSTHEDGVVLDAGAKSLTKDRPGLLEGHGLMPDYPDAIVERLYDYHAVVRLPDGSARPALGDVLAIVPNHICPVVDLYDSFVAVDGAGGADRWSVDARGRSG